MVPKPNELDAAAARRHDVWVEVGFPEYSDRLSFLKTTLQPCSILSEPEYEELSRNCKDCTFFEMKRMVAQIINKKTTADQKMTTFKIDSEGNYQSCSPGESKKVTIDLADIPAGKLRGAPLTFNDLKNRFKNPIQAAQSNQKVEITKFKEKYPKEMEKKTLEI